MNPSPFEQIDGALRCRHNGETILIEAWGRDALRIRAAPGLVVRQGPFSALVGSATRADAITIDDAQATLVAGRIKVEARNQPMHGEPKSDLVLRFVDAVTGDELAREERPHPAGPGARLFETGRGGRWRCQTSFAAHEDERFYGLGQHQHGLLDQKGCVLDLVQRNAEISIPFTISSRGYGFLWNLPATGRVELGRSLTRWIADAAPGLDYWITAGEPEAALRNYVEATGRPPMMPHWATGFWQSRLRYRNQEEVLTVAREHRKRGLPLACIVIDFFHWTKQGEWRFDPDAWPDPSAMVEELRELGVETMVSVWPTVNPNAADFQRMRADRLLVGTDRGPPYLLNFIDNGPGPMQLVPVAFYDASHPDARALHMEKVREGYRVHGIRSFWLDACEPEALPAQPDNLRFFAGHGEEVFNAYPAWHVGLYDEEVRLCGEPEAITLARSAWAGSQRHASVVWSGDIPSTFDAMRRQVVAGLNAAMSGIGWWTCDIGGFFHGKGADPGFRELLIRWFQWGAFLPVFRLHGFRLPEQMPTLNESAGEPVSFAVTGGPNEVWSFGDETYALLQSYMSIRERLRPYVADAMRAFSSSGTPPIRPLLLAFPDDPDAASISDAHMFGPDLLVAPVLEAGATSRTVYLPRGAKWRDVWTGEVHGGGQSIAVPAPISRIPLFVRDGAELSLLAN